MLLEYINKEKKFIFKTNIGDRLFFLRWTSTFKIGFTYFFVFNNSFCVFFFFRIKHFGGVVTYDSRDFVERNRDALDRELSQAMYECDHPILKVLFPEGKLFW